MGLVVTRWQRYGHDRLYVKESGGQKALGYFDCKAGRLELGVEHKGRTYEVMEALRPFLGSSVPESLRGLMADTPVPVESDLSRNRAGEAIAARAAELRPRGVQGVVARVLGLRTEATSWEVGAKGERIVDKRLGKLARDGWQVLSSVMKRSGADIDHVVIGPPGVFTINTKHHREARIWVGEHTVRVNSMQQRYLPKSRHEAESAARVLGGAVGVPVKVTPVLAFVGAASIDTRKSSGDVLVARGEEIDRVLRNLPAVYSIPERERIYAVARRAEIWLA
jgi:hypothetical protein